MPLFSNLLAQEHADSIHSITLSVMEEMGLGQQDPLTIKNFDAQKFAELVTLRVISNVLFGCSVASMEGKAYEKELIRAIRYGNKVRSPALDVVLALLCVWFSSLAYTYIYHLHPWNWSDLGASNVFQLARPQVGS
jgi:maleate cis-trans isomerase